MEPDPGVRAQELDAGEAVDRAQEAEGALVLAAVAYVRIAAIPLFIKPAYLVTRSTVQSAARE
jgi:hypothetical protein